jgi:sodium/proline symporter
MQTPIFPLITTLVIYLIIVYIIGFIASKTTNNLSDYVLGGRRLSALIVSLAAGASDMSGWLLLALPGAVFVSGVKAMWLPIGLSIGAYLNWTLIAKRLRIYTEAASNSLTIPTFLKHRFQGHHSILGIVTTIVILIFFTMYTASGFVAGTLLLSTFFNLSYQIALLITVLGIVIYVLIGGFLALSWIDFFQGSLMFFALLIVPMVTVFHIDLIGNFHHMIAKLPASHWQLYHSTSWIFILSMLGWGLGYCGQPHILVRFMAIAKPNKLGIARNICMFWMILSLLGASAIGLVGAIYYSQLAKPDTVMLHLAMDFFNPWVVGFIIAAVLSAVMSTTSAQLLVNSSALTEDIYHRLRKNATQKELLIIGRLAIAVCALIAYAIAANPHASLLQIVGYAWSGLGAAFGPVIILALYWPRCTQTGAIVGIIVGAATVIIWHVLGEKVGGIFELYELIPGFVLAFISNVIVSLIDKKHNHESFKEFQLLRQKYASQ